MIAGILESVGPLVAVLAPLAAVPLTLITFYLRSIHEQQVAGHAQLVQRLERAESALAELRKTLGDMERDFATKEEWLRECMHNRRIVERLTESVVRLDAVVRGGAGPREP